MDVESTIGATISVDHGNGVFTNCESIQIGCLQSDDGAAGLDLIVCLVNILTINLDTNELAEQAVNNEGDVMVAAAGTAPASSTARNKRRVTVAPP